MSEFNRDFFDSINFPYSEVRLGQDDFINQVYKIINEKRNILVSAPTGLGKTVSALAPAIKIAKEKNLTVIFLTSRQTQANQAIKTIKDISKKSKNPVNYMAFIGKRNMCVHPDRDLYPASDFNEFCKKMKETGKCKYFKNTKNDDYEEQIKTILDQSSKVFMSVEGFVQLSGSNNFCPYELAGKKAFHADVVICDFNYMFSESIRENILGKIGRTLEECIVVVDEAHNLADRIRNAYTFTLSTELIKNSVKELTDFIKTKQYDPYILNLKSTFEEIYFDKVLGEKTEYMMTKKEFIDSYVGKFNTQITIKKIIDELREVEALVKDERIISYVGRVANFLESWLELDEESYLRILEKNIKEDKTVLSLKLQCIDPSDISSEIVNHTYSTILMSATLSPAKMYKDILGVANADILELESPFSKQNQLILALTDVTSKYSSRGTDMYKKISDHVENCLGAASDKNAIVFFPSYDFMEKIVQNINIVKMRRKVLKEQRYMTKEQKEEYIEKFRDNGGFDNKAKVLFAITSGSFSEGLDLPDSALEMVIIVGLPLSVPDMFTEAVIRHYEAKYKRGQMYGYIFPAMSKIIQAAGRCIRTETDKGVIVLIDTRFMWPLYAQTFPKHWHLIKSDDDYKLKIMNFFDR